MFGLRRISSVSKSVRALNPQVARAINVRLCSTDAEKHEFKAETRKLLDIVTHSIYTDKEVFLRELISNSSDALEKCRYLQATNSISGDGKPLGINIDTSTTDNTIVITDNGIGMSKEDLVSNLGTIARSGSKAFVESLKDSGSDKDAESIIGQFGVGFYSSFMVSEEVSFESNPAPIVDSTDAPTNGHVWSSDGTGDYTITNSTDTELVHGSKITLKLKSDCAEFADDKRLKGIIQKYSNFVSFPITVNGEVVNKVSALWAQEKSNVTKEQYDEFYKFISNGFDTARYTLHFRADAPLELKVLLFLPTIHTEKFGMGRMEPGVSLYSRKVLITHQGCC